MNEIELQKETAIHNEQQSNELNNTKILLNIETHLKSIADSLSIITEKGIDIYKRTWN